MNTFLEPRTEDQEHVDVSRWESMLETYAAANVKPLVSEARVRAWCDQAADMNIEMSRLMAQRGITGDTLEDQFNAMLRLIDVHVRDK
jgi:hypothetical protein